MSEAVEITLVTAPDEATAAALARALVEERFAAVTITGNYPRTNECVAFQSRPWVS